MDTQMIVAAAKVFGISEEEAALRAEEFTQAPITLVEHEGYLRGEDKRLYDIRRRCSKVHISDYKELVMCLRELGGSTVTGMTPWELMLTYYKSIASNSESLVDCEESISTEESKGEEYSEEEHSDATYAAEVREPVAKNSEEQVDETTATDTSEKEVSVEPKIPTKETIEIDSIPSVPEASTENEESIRDNSSASESPATHRSDDESGLSQKESEPSKPVTREEDSSRDNAQKQGTAKCTTTQEDKKMSVESLLNTAKGIMNAGGAQAGSVAATAPISPNEEINAEMKSVIKESYDVRKEYMCNNNVTGLVATSQSVKDRLVPGEGTKGPLVKTSAKSTDPDGEAKKKLDERIKAHVVALTGKATMTYDLWQTLEEEGQYAMCIADEDKAVAKAIMTTLLEAKATPNKMYELSAPEKSNYAYKGLVIGANDYKTPSELTVLLVDHTLGTLYGEGMFDQATGDLTELGKDAKTLVKVGINYQNKKVSTPKNTGKNGKNEPTISAQATQQSVGVAALTGREALINAGKVVLLFPHNTAERKSAQLVVLLDVNGKKVPATYSVQQVDDKGNPLFKKLKKNETEADKKPKTKKMSLKGAGTVFAVDRTIAPAFIEADQTAKEACLRWNISVPSVDKNNVFPDDASDTVVYKYITSEKNSMQANGSALQQTFLGLINKKNEAEAADAKQSMEEA